jgi:hypothetical protein
MKKIILILTFFLISNLVQAKTITINNCYVMGGSFTTEPTSLKELKENYDKDEYIIDTERKTITHNVILNEKSLQKGGEKIFVDIFNLDYFDGKFAKGSRKEKIENINSYTITFNLSENTYKGNLKGIDMINKEYELSWDYKCSGNNSNDILKKIIGK